MLLRCNRLQDHVSLYAKTEQVVRGLCEDCVQLASRPGGVHVGAGQPGTVLLVMSHAKPTCWHSRYRGTNFELKLDNEACLTGISSQHTYSAQASESPSAAAVVDV